MSDAARDGCCATWPKPCSYHEGWADGAEKAEADAAACRIDCERADEALVEAMVRAEEATQRAEKAQRELAAALIWLQHEHVIAEERTGGYELNPERCYVCAFLQRHQADTET